MSISSKPQLIAEKQSLTEQQTYLTALLGLERQPVGIGFYDTQDTYENGSAPQPKAGLPYCTCVNKATQGHCYKLDAAHCRCMAASTALGLLPAAEERRSGKLYTQMNVYKNADVSQSVAADMVYCQKSHIGVEIAPFGKSTIQPKVVVIICSPKSAMRLLQGYAYHFGQLKNIKMAGMCGICQECTSYPLEKNEPNVSLLCSGTRCVGRWNPQELGIGIPYSQLAAILDGIWQTADPMESDEDKSAIIARFTKLNLQPPVLTKHHNYYSNCYGTPTVMAKKQNSK